VEDRFNKLARGQVGRCFNYRRALAVAGIGKRIKGEFVSGDFVFSRHGRAVAVEVFNGFFRQGVSARNAQSIVEQGFWNLISTIAARRCCAERAHSVFVSLPLRGVRLCCIAVSDTSSIFWRFNFFRGGHFISFAI
jgi:hypothetical protein